MGLKSSSILNISCFHVSTFSWEMSPAQWPDNDWHRATGDSGETQAPDVASASVKSLGASSSHSSSQPPSLITTWQITHCHDIGGLSLVTQTSSGPDWSIFTLQASHLLIYCIGGVWAKMRNYLIIYSQAHTLTPLNLLYEVLEHIPLQYSTFLILVLNEIGSKCPIKSGY